MDMHGAMHRFQQDMERSFGGFGFSSMFGSDRAGSGGGGLFGSFDRMFDQAFSTMSSDNHNGNGSYYFESRTRTVGPDGRVREEHVRTVPDAEGNPQTRHTVCGAESESGMDPFYSGIGGYDRGYERIPDVDREPEIIVEEVDDDDMIAEEEAERRRSRGRRRPRSHYGDVEVEEIVDEPEERLQSTGEWMRDSYRRWRTRQ